MLFKINENFAKNYNRYRQKEEYEKLKARYGDARLKNTKLPKQTEGGEEVTEEKLSTSNLDTAEEESTSSSSTDSDSSWEEKEQEDFLTLYQALCTNDPSLNDPNKQWFRDPNASEESAESSNEITEVKINKADDAKKTKKRALKLRDYEREFLLSHNGLEDEETSKEAEKVVKMESDEILKKLKASAEDISKEQFLQEANEALQQAAANTDEKETDSAELDLNFLQKRKTEEKSSNKKAKNECSYDLEKIVFTDSSNKEAEEFLRDYIINKRWREGNARGRNSIPAYSDVLRKAGFDVDDKTKNFPKDDDILDEDDEFLVKVNDSEKERLQSLGVHVGISQMQKVQHRFEEEDKEFIKSYPRYIENSIGQTLSKTSKRAEKRKAKMERKRKEKQAKFQELARLRNLKLGMLAEKIERIKRSCGPGSLPLDINKLFTSQTEDESKQCPQHTETSNNVDALDVAEYLDEDWDPDKHEQLLSSMFGKEYEEVDEDISKPEFSDDSDLEVEHVTNIKEKSASKKKCEQDASYGLNNDFQEELTETQSNDNDVCNRIPTMNVNTKSSRSKRKLHEALERKKPVFDPDDYPDYEKYFEEFYQLHCEDIIPGSSADEDIYCRFKYRNVTPNDFGLSTEEILKADTKELNAWISLKRIVSYLSNDEEMRDKELYSSHYQIKRKKQILNSLNSPEATWWPKEKEDGDDESASSKKKRRRRRKKAKLNGQEIKETEPSKRSAELDEVDMENPEQHLKAKNHKHNEGSQRPNEKAIFESRLQAAGITLKEYYRSMHKQNKCKS